MRTPLLADLKKNDSIGSHRVELSRADLVRYAAASGDHNPIHYNERFAREVGLDGVIAHGMLTMAMAAELVTEWVGDPGAIVDYQTRFTQPVPVPDVSTGSPERKTVVITVAGAIGSIDEDKHTARVDLTVQYQPLVAASGESTMQVRDGSQTNTGSEDSNEPQEPVKVLTKAQAVVSLKQSA